MPADSRDMVLVPREPTPEMIEAGCLEHGQSRPECDHTNGSRLRRAWSAMLSASPARGEGDAPPHGYLVKDFADGWFWTRDASLACADGAAVWSLQHGRYETEAKPPAPSPGEGDAPVAWLLTHPTEPADCELAAPFREPLTDADRAAGWDAAALYTRPTPATPEGLREALTDLHMTPHAAATGHEYSPDGSGHCRHCGADGPHLTARREAEKTERERSMEREAAAELYAAIDHARRDWNTDVSIKAEVAETLLAIAIEARDLPPEHVASDRGDPGVNEKETTAHSKAEQDGRGEDTPCRSPVFSAAYDSIRKSAPGLSDRTCEAIARSIAIKVRHAAKEATPEGLREKLEHIRDLLMERKQGSTARSPAHNARLEVEAILAALQPQAEGE